MKLLTVLQSAKQPTSDTDLLNAFPKFCFNLLEDFLEIKTKLRATTKSQKRPFRVLLKWYRLFSKIFDRKPSPPFTQIRMERLVCMAGKFWLTLEFSLQLNRSGRPLVAHGMGLKVALLTESHSVFQRCEKLTFIDGFGLSLTV